MLPPANRLKKEKEIKRALASKNSRKSGLLLCKTVPNSLPVSRFCFVVSRHVGSKAVVRNKLKRRLREAVKSFLPQIKPGFDCVIITLPGAQKNNYDELLATTKNVLTASGVLETQ